MKNAFLDYIIDNGAAVGFKVFNGINSVSFFTDSDKDLSMWYSIFTKWCIQLNIEDFYGVGHSIGKGAFGEVNLFLIFRFLKEKI
jgi:hypothetical protein